MDEAITFFMNEMKKDTDVERILGITTDKYRIGKDKFFQIFQKYVIQSLVKAVADKCVDENSYDLERAYNTLITYMATKTDVPGDVLFPDKSAVENHEDRMERYILWKKYADFIMQRENKNIANATQAARESLHRYGMSSKAHRSRQAYKDYVSNGRMILEMKMGRNVAEKKDVASGTDDLIPDLIHTLRSQISKSLEQTETSIEDRKLYARLLEQKYKELLENIATIFDDIHMILTTALERSSNVPKIVQMDMKSGFVESVREYT